MTNLFLRFLIITNKVMKDNIGINIEPSESDTSRVEDQYGKASPSNKLIHQAEPEMEYQVPQREQKALIERKEHNPEQLSKGPTKKRKRKRERAKDKYRAKRFKAKNSIIYGHPSTEVSQIKIAI